MRCGFTSSATGQTGQSEAIHSPEAWASMVVRLTIPAAGSMAVVCTVAISCWPNVFRTMSRPPASGAYRKLRSPSPGLPLRIVAVSDFSGLTSSACALASAAARAATDSLHLGMGGLRGEKIEVHCPRLRALPSHPMPDRLPDVLRHQGLELAFRPLMVEEGLPCI